jgi:nitrogen fixation/metabolism regulation signal transduction histidine kinase
MQIIAKIPKTVILSISSELQGITGRIDEIIISFSAVLMLILWIPVAVSFFSIDENKRVEARQRLKNAIIGTFIYALAISGVIYAIFKYIASGA